MYGNLYHILMGDTHTHTHKDNSETKKNVGEKVISFYRNSHISRVSCLALWT